MTSPPGSYRGLKFLSTWTLANALGVGSISWLAVLLAELSFEYVRLALFTMFFGFGIVALLQQFLLGHYGLPSPLWWLTSYLGWGAGGFAGMIAEAVFLEIVDDWTSLSDYRFQLAAACAAMIFGLAFGAVQSLASQPLRQRSWIWPLASSLAFPPAVLIASLVPACREMFGIYLVVLFAGAAYGGITGAFLAPLIGQLGSQTPKR